MNSASKYLSAAFLAVTLLTAVGCSSTRTQESTGEYTDDVAITAKVKAAILGEATLKSAEINVDTLTGVVTMRGSVSYQALPKQAAG